MSCFAKADVLAVEDVRRVNAYAITGAWGRAVDVSVARLEAAHLMRMLLS